jgi:hypothetical protein
MRVSVIGLKELFGADRDLLQIHFCHGHAKPFPDEPVLKDGTKKVLSGLP